MTQTPATAIQTPVAANPVTPPATSAMSAATAAEQTRATQVSFLEYHRPALTPGRYTVQVRQDIAGPGITPESFRTARRFTVAGQPLTLAPADVYAVFPPDGSLGDHSDVLPHVILSRSTAPWEYSADSRADSGGDGSPWLALLLLTEQDTLGGTIDRDAFLTQYQRSSTPTDQQANQQDPQAVWDHLLDPRVGWLRPVPPGPDVALIVSRASRTSATLDGGFTSATAGVEVILDRHRSPQVVTVADLTGATTGPLHWPGLQVDPDQNLDTDKVTVIDVEKRLLDTLLPPAAGLRLLTHVRRAQDAAGQPVDDDRAVVLGSRLPQRNGISVVHLVSVQGRYTDGHLDDAAVPDGDYLRLVSLKSWRFACVDPHGSFAGLLTGLDRTPSTLRQPPRPDGQTERYLSAGYVPVPHRSRRSGSTVSWYHGPLIPGPSPAEVPLPAQTGDTLVRYDPAVGMLDVSYAAAWELGRLLALQSPQISTELYTWKRTHAQAARSAEDWLLHPGWAQPPGGNTAAAAQLPADVVAWFEQLRLLAPVPFAYLVSDDRMLPPESIRFVQLDHAWLDCLVDGAFSLGRLTGTLKDVDHDQKDMLVQTLVVHPTVSGFLLRSSVVAGWPGLLVDAYGPADAAGSPGPPLDTLRAERLASDVLLCLFSGQVARIQLHQRPETLHFGTAGLGGNIISATGVLDVVALAQSLRTGPDVTSADLAARVIEGVPRVTFTVA